MPQNAVFDRMDWHRNPEKQKMKKIKSVNIMSLANFTAITTGLVYLTFTILMVVFGGLLGGMMGGGADMGAAAGGGLVAGLIGTVVALPVSWIVGLIYGLFINLALKATGGLSLEIEG